MTAIRTIVISAVAVVAVILGLSVLRLGHHEGYTPLQRDVASTCGYQPASLVQNDRLTDYPIFVYDVPHPAQGGPRRLRAEISSDGHIGRYLDCGN